MPEAFVIEQKTLPTITVASGSEEQAAATAKSETKGIGNTLGFRITGGADFHMPITIFHVAESSRAEKAGLKLGDSIVSVNGQDTSKMTLLQANSVLEQVSNKDEIKLGITKFDEVDEENPNQTPQVHEVVIEGNKKTTKLPFEEELQPPRDAFIAQPTRKAWHPVMWEQQEFKLSENYQPEQPHKRVVRNIRKLLSSVADNPSERAKYIEDLLLALPRGSRQRRDDDDE